MGPDNLTKPIWPSTVIDSLDRSRYAAYLSVMSMSVNAIMRSNLLVQLWASENVTS